MKNILVTTCLSLLAMSSVFAQTTFNYTGGMQNFVAPSTGSYSIEAFGASGGDVTSYYPTIGGEGGYAIGEVSLTAGQSVFVYVGGKGEDRLGNHPYSSCTSAAGGYNGGGMTSSAGNSTPGGGASDVRIGGTALIDRVIVAGGGGGGGWNYSVGGDGGGLTAENGTNTGGTGTGAYGGSQISGGNMGAGGSSCSVTSGSLGQGGDGGGSSAGGGGGGGGYYGGGGGGYSDGGGGGSSYIGGVSSGSVAIGGNVGNGQVIITLLCSPTILTADLTLADVVEECSMAMPTPPTATNDCGVTFNGTTVTVFPITAQGTTVITWNYDDGQGNTTSQTQNVILTDVTAPVADSASLPDLSDMCGVTSVTAPTATDNCAGQITGTTTTTFPVTTPGASVITWTFDDGQGNVSTQTQNILNGAIDVGISQTGTQLTADALVAAYQWLDCDNNYSIIAGEVNQFYTPAVTGSYAVEITQGGCVDTSACVLVDFTGIEEMNLQGLSMYPNPTSGMMTINFTGEIKNIEVVDMVGRLISLPSSVTDKTVNATQLTAGKYMIRITTENDQVLVREFVVQN